MSIGAGIMIAVTVISSIVSHNRKPSGPPTCKPGLYLAYERGEFICKQPAKTVKPRTP